MTTMQRTVYYGALVAAFALAGATLLLSSRHSVANLGVVVLGGAVGLEGLALLMNWRDSTSALVREFATAQSWPLSMIGPNTWRFVGGGYVCMGLVLVVAGFAYGL